MTQAANLGKFEINVDPLPGDTGNSAWRGRILSICESGSDQLPYFFFLPSKLTIDTPPIVTIHGWMRNAGEHAFRLARYAEENGAALIAPLFSRKAHKHYQRLEIRPRETCPAAHLDNLLSRVAEQFQIKTSRINLFGFSGGAQFAHRYAMMRPFRVHRMALMAAGWYTFPDKKKAPYPLGTAPSKLLGDRTLYIDKFLEIPTCVIVGGHDVNRDASLRTGKRIDGQQGFTRVERAERWVCAAQDAARARNIEAEFKLNIIHRANHDFGECIEKHQMGEAIFDWLIPDQEGADL